MIDEAATNDGHRFEAAMRVLRKPGNDIAVVHAPAIARAEVATNVAPGERRSWAERCVRARISVVVMDAKEERIGRRPWRRAERDDGFDDLGRTG